MRCEIIGQGSLAVVASRLIAISATGSPTVQLVCISSPGPGQLPNIHDVQSERAQSFTHQDIFPAFRATRNQRNPIEEEELPCPVASILQKLAQIRKSLSHEEAQNAQNSGI